MEIAAVGRDEFVQGFKLAGVRKTYSVGREGLEQQVARVLDDPEVGILVLSSDDLEALSPGMRRRLETTPRPVMIAVGRKEEEDLRTKIKRAIGVDLYK
jgi:V/A-type H+-transporting ATPase subunit F